MRSKYDNSDLAITGAMFSDCKKYRYALWRIWDRSKPMVGFIGLNPSTANHLKDDPTIRRVAGFAKEWNYGGIIMMNLFGYVTAHPPKLKKCDDPIGDNNYHITDFAKRCDKIVFAWGSFPQAEERAKLIASWFPDAMCLKKNLNGSPGHPLYIKKETKLIPFNNTDNNG